MTQQGRWLASWMCRFLIGATFLIIDPFGISASTDAATEKIFLRLLAPFHGMGSPQAGTLNQGGLRVAETLGQKAVTVVLIDQQFVNYSKKARTWPLARRVQAEELLRPILEHEPAMVFIDLVYAPKAEQRKSSETQSNRTGDEIFSDELRAMATENNRSIPIFLADVFELPSPKSDEILQTVYYRDVAEKKAVSPVFFETEKKNNLVSNNNYAKKSDDIFEIVNARWYGSEDLYPLYTYEVGKSPRKSDKGLLVSPAMAMYIRWCALDGRDQKLSPGCPQVRDLRERIGVAGYRYYGQVKEFKQPMLPVWGAAPSAIQAKLLGRTYVGDELRKCVEERNRSRVGHFIHFLKTGLLDLGREHTRRAAYNQCFAITTLSAHFFQLERDLPQWKNFLDDAVRGRIVIIGEDDSVGNDVVSSPSHGSAPGALLHATALENLITMGSSYFHDPEAIRLPVKMHSNLPQYLPWKIVLQLFAFALLCGLVLAWERSFSSSQTDWERGRKAGLFLAFTGIIVTVFAMALTVVCKLAPANWLGALLGLLLVSGDILVKAFAPTAARQSLLLPTGWLGAILRGGIAILAVIVAIVLSTLWASNRLSEFLEVLNPF